MNEVITATLKETGYQMVPVDFIGRQIVGKVPAYSDPDEEGSEYRNAHRSLRIVRETLRAVGSNQDADKVFSRVYGALRAKQEQNR